MPVIHYKIKGRSLSVFSESIDGGREVEALPPWRNFDEDLFQNGGGIKKEKI
jgi:hypothetical protein